jgi:hypothetical protein
VDSHEHDCCDGQREENDDFVTNAINKFLHCIGRATAPLPLLRKRPGEAPTPRFVTSAHHNLERGTCTESFFSLFTRSGTSVDSPHHPLFRHRLFFLRAVLPIQLSVEQPRRALE